MHGTVWRLMCTILNRFHVYCCGVKLSKQSNVCAFCDERAFQVFFPRVHRSLRICTGVCCVYVCACVRASWASVPNQIKSIKQGWFWGRCGAGPSVANHQAQPTPPAHRLRLPLLQQQQPAPQGGAARPLQHQALAALSGAGHRCHPPHPRHPLLG